MWWYCINLDTPIVSSIREEVYIYTPPRITEYLVEYICMASHPPPPPTIDGEGGEYGKYCYAFGGELYITLKIDSTIWIIVTTK